MNDIIGPAAVAAQECKRVVAKRRARGAGSYVMLYGTPGNGKSTAARALAAEHAAGGVVHNCTMPAQVSIDLVRTWIDSAALVPLCNTAIVIDEIDQVNPVAMAGLSALYDLVENRPDILLIATTNRKPEKMAANDENSKKLADRFAIRFAVGRPENGEIAGLLVAGGCDDAIAADIAADCDSVRSALLRADCV